MMEREVLLRGLVICHSQWRRRKGNFREGDVSPEDFYCFSIQTERLPNHRGCQRRRKGVEAPHQGPRKPLCVSRRTLRF